jgi:hypothetical protein
MEKQDVQKITKFSAAYQQLAVNSVLICRSDDGKAEVYETHHDLLTVVDFPKVAFFTRSRDQDPAKYEGARQEFLSEKRNKAWRRIQEMPAAQAFQHYEKGDQTYALALVANHPEYYNRWTQNLGNWAEKAAGTVCLMEDCGRSLYESTDDPTKFSCPCCGSTYSAGSFLEFVSARKGTAEKACKENLDETAQIRKDMQALAVRLQQLKVERKILVKHAKDWGVA